MKENQTNGTLRFTGKTEMRNNSTSYIETECTVCGNVSFRRRHKFVNVVVTCSSCQSGKITYGMTNTKIYGVWCDIKKRCGNKKVKNYHRYGGRGITYDKKWETFEGFYEDMGSTYKEGLQIDRIDNDSDYTKENCKWVTCIENMQHTSKTYELYLPNGKLVSLAGFCRYYNLEYDSVSHKVYKGMITIQQLQDKYNT